MIFSKIKNEIGYDFAFITCCIFIISVFLNLEINIIEIKNSIERLSNSSIIMGENEKTYSRSNYANIPLNLIDVVFILSFVYLILFKKSSLNKYAKTVLQNSLSLKIHITILSLFLLSLLSLIINYELFTNLQLKMQMLHLFKIIEIFIIFLIFKIFLQNINIENFFKFFVLSSFIFSLIGIIHFLNILNLKEVIDTRVTFCGILILNLIFLPTLIFSKNLKFINTTYWRLIFYSMIFMSVLSCFISGKRTITIIVIILLPILLIYINYFLKKYLKKHFFYLMFSFIVPFFIGVTLQFHIYSQTDINFINKTFDGKNKVSSIRSLLPYDSLTTYNICLFLIKKNQDTKDKLVNDIFNINNLNKLDYSEISALKKIDYKTFKYINKNCFLYKLDASTIIRINKFFKSLILTVNKPFFGHGFWGTQYHYNFLPDSGLQIVLEIGYLGLFTMLLLLFYLFKLLKISKKNNYSDIFLFIISVFFISLLLIFSNVFYEWRFLLILLIYWKFIFFKYVKKNSDI